jgi:2-oxopent-4-enoate/cis-2-oxohex-4-enoate hydratase
MTPDIIESLSEELYQAQQARRAIEPLVVRHPQLQVESAYRIQRGVIDRFLQRGARIVGKKIGVTSKAVMDMLGVHQPDFGYLLDHMICTQGQTVDAGRLLQPKAEGEIAFVLGRDLRGPGVTQTQVVDATVGLSACIEIVDSRIRDWKITICDTVADNASCGLFVLGDRLVDPGDVDLFTCGMVLEKNGDVAVTGAGAAALGSPAAAVAWLANMLGSFGESLKAGDVILSGALAAMVPVGAGDSIRVEIDGIGCCGIRFA